MNHPRILTGMSAAALTLLAACQPKTTGTTAAASDTSPPVAAINGAPISRDFYEFYIKGISGGKTSADLNPRQRDMALENLIRARLVAAQAAKDGVDKDGNTAYLLELSRLNVLEQAMEERYLKDRKPTDDELRAEYQSQLLAMPKTEYHARHVLVATEPFARKIIERLDKGEKFDEIARKESMDSSKANGGDLGWFTPERMVPEFAGAVTVLKIGDYTHRPIQTQYGWHVIQLLETRDLTPPPYDKVKDRLGQVVQAKKFRTYTDELMRAAKIDKMIDKSAAAPAGAPPAGSSSATPAGAAPATGGAADSKPQG